MKRAIRPLIFSIILLLSPLISWGQELYWVGGSGNWNEAENWASESGGNGGAGIPDENIDAIFDEHSFQASSETVRISGTASCRTFDFNGPSDKTVHIHGKSSSLLKVDGDLFLNDLGGLKLGEIRFQGKDPSSIRTDGTTLRADLSFNGEGGWMLNDELRTADENLVSLDKGSLDLQGNRFRTGNFISEGSPSRSLTLGEGAAFEILEGIELNDTASFNLRPKGGSFYIDEQIPPEKVRLSGIDKEIFGARDNSGTTCNFGDCINEIKIIPQDTAQKNGFDISCPDSCDGKFIATITDSSGCDPNDTYSYDWSISGSYQQNDSLVWEVCNQANIEVQITNDATGQFCQVGYSLEVPFRLKKFTNNKTQPSCPGFCDGEIEYIPTDGVKPYSYQWNNGDTTQTADSLCAGNNHQVLVTDDNDCKLRDTLSLDEPPVIDPNLNTTDASCADTCDGTAKVNPSGGNGSPYYYEWSTGATSDSIGGLCDGNYSVTVYDQDSCIETVNFTIDEPLPMQIDLDSTQDLFCHDSCEGWISVTVSDGTPPYNYEWYDAGTGNPISPQQDTSLPGDLCAGDYYVEVTDDNGCKEFSDTFSLDQPDPLQHDTSSTNVLCADDCNGQTALDTVFGGTPPYSYEWFDSSGTSIGITDSVAPGLCTGDYYAVISDANGCELVSDTMTVNAPPPLDLSSSKVDILCFGDCDGEATVSIDGGVQPYSVDWYDGSGNPIGATDTTADSLCAGSYYAIVEDANNCKDTTDTVSIDQPPELTSSISSTDVVCNGDCDGTATVSINGGVSPYDVDWIDASSGSSIGQTDTTATGLCPGDYYAVITDDNGCLDSSDTATIDQPPPLDVDLTVTHISCGGACDGEITANVSGGTPNYDYQWFDASTGNPLGTSQTQSNLCPGDYYVEVTDDNGCSITSADSTVTEPPPLSLSMDSVNPSCNDSCDGMAIADVSGGTPPYSYNWTDGSGNSIPVNDDTLTGRCAGTYNVSITDDNGCSIGPENVTLEDPAPLDPTLSVQDASCNGDCDGEATVSMSGGTSPYTYSWSTGGSGSTEDSLCAGNHSVTIVDDNGCDTTVDFTVNEPGELTLNPSTQDVSCNGDCDGEAEVSISGGTTPYDIQWLDNAGNPIPGETDSIITGLCPGDYGVEVEDSNGCYKLIDTLTIDEPDPLGINLNVTDVTCNGDCDGEITANVSGGTPNYDYQWFDSSGFPLGTGQTQNNLCPGDYYVEVTDANGCTETSSTVTVTQPPALSLSTDGEDISCFGICDGEAWADVSGGTPPYNYNWTDGAGNAVGSSDTISNLCEDNYTVNIVDDNGCTIGPETVSINEPDSLDIDFDKTDVSCNGDCDGSAEVSVSGGTPPYSYNWSTGSTDSTETNICPGNHSVTVSDDNGCDTTIQFSIDEPSPLDVTVNTTDPTCAGLCDGSATANISGGTTPYSIQWYDSTGTPISGDTTTSVSGYCEGDYSIEVVDSNGCTSSENITLDAPQVMNLSIDSTDDASCGEVCDGAAWITVSGGNSPYSYDWIDATTGNSTGITQEDPDSLCSGQYYVEVTDDNNCTINSDTITINEDVVISGTTDHNDASCFGYCDGSAWVNASGGTSPYSYVWTNTGTGDTIGSTDSITGLCADTFAVTVIDSIGCKSAPMTVIVDEASLLTLETDSTPASCNGGSDGTATVTPSGGTPPYSYSWGPGTGGQTDSMATGLSAGTYDVTVTDDNGCSEDTSVTVTEPSPVNADLSIEDASCNGICDGKAWVGPNGGVGNYDIQWYDNAGNPIPGASSDTLDNLCADAYAVSVTDSNGCKDSVNFTIGEPGPINASISSKSDVSCNGANDGSATASASGGNTPYSYQWDDPGNQTGATASNLAPGNYTVVVTDDEGCQDSTQVTIDEPDVLDFELDSVEVSCEGDCDGMAIVDTTMGGTPPYTVDWNDPLNQTGDTAIQLCPGTYEATITDANGCDTSGTLTIGEPPALDIDVVDINEPTCSSDCDGSIDIDVNGGTGGYNYIWTDVNTGDTVSNAQDPSNLCAGDYNVEVTDANDCVEDSTITVDQPPAMTLDVDTTKASCGDCDGELAIDVNNGTAPYSYSWSPAPGGGSGTDSIYDLCPDVYTVDVTDANGCTQQFSIPLTNQDGEDITTDSSLVSCPGSCDGIATVDIIGGCSDPSCSIEWLDSSGASIGQTGDSATGLCEGLYYVEVTNGSGCISLDSIQINSPGKVQPNLSLTDASCGGTCDGEASASPSGGTAPYSYSWSSGSTPNDSMTGGLCAGTHSVTITDANGCDTTASFVIDEPPELLINSKDSSGVSCNGDSDGSATVFPAGGTPGYAYEWYDCSSGTPIGQTGQQANNLSAGSYYAVVTDNNGCTVTSTCIEVVEPPVLNADASVVQHITCNGDDDGQAEVTPSGGTSPYDYEWRDKNGNLVSTDSFAVNLSPGTYGGIVIDSNGCEAVDSVTINEPAALSASANVDPASCNGDCDGMIDVSVSGGVIPHSYQWYDGVGNPMAGETDSVLVACAGTYTLEVVDGNGCSISYTDSIPEPPELDLSSSTDAGTCNGSCDGSATVHASGGNGSPYSYQWLDSLQNPLSGETDSTLDNACAGDYYAVVEDGMGCSDSIAISVDEPDSLTATTSSNNSTCGNCDGSASVNPTGGTSPYDYQWDASAGNQTTQMATGLCAGIYSVVVTDDNGCSGTFTAAVSDQGAENVTTDSTDVSCFGACDGEAIADYTCTDPSCTVEWYDASTGAPIGQSGDTATNLCAGDYYAEVTNGSGCKALEPVTVESPDPLEANDTLNDVSCAGDCDGSISVSPSGGTPSYNYTWTDSTGSVIGSGNSVSNLCPGSYELEIVDANGCDTTFSFDVDEPAPLDISKDSTNILCNGDCNGEAAVTPSGGSGPYDYQWFDSGGSIPGATDSSISGLCADTYEVLVTDDNGCDTLVEIDIEEPAPIQSNMDQEDLLCEGDCNGSAWVDPSGGVGPYSYQWYDGSGVAIPGETDSIITGLCAGDVEVAIMDANGCTVSDSTSIDEPAPLALSFDSIAHPSCNGTCDGMISISASGGTPGSVGYSYQWYDGSGNPLPNSDTTYLNTLCGGDYSIEVSDSNGCSHTVDTTLFEPAPITATINSNDADCGVNNGSANVTNVSGGSGSYSYQWFDNSMNPIGTGPSISGLSSGLYELEITDSLGCTEDFSVTINDVNAPSITTDSIDAVTCAGGSDGAIYVSVSGGTPPYDYLWNPGGTTTEDLTGAEAGIYTLEVTDDSGCTSFYEDTIPEGDSILANFSTSDATCGDCDGEAVVSASGGTAPYSYQWSTGSTNDSVSGLCAGVHTVQVTDSLGCQEDFDVTISDNGGPTVDNIDVTPVTCNGDCDGEAEVFVSGGTPPYDYHWLFDGSDSSYHDNLCGGIYYVQIEDDDGCKTTATVNIPEPSALEDSANIFPTACGACDGMIDLHVDGGTPPYNYSWSNGESTPTIDSLCEGTYSVTVEDNNGCTKDFTYNIAGSNAPQVDASATDISCNGACDGEAVAVVTGSSTVTYEWLDANGNPIGQSDSIASGLCPGEYSIEVEDTNSGCMAYDQVLIEEPDSLQFNLPNVQDVSCNGDCDGEATISYSGGSMPYDVNWSPSGDSTAQATGLCADTHTVQVIDANACTTSTDVQVDEPAPITVSIDSTAQPQCSNTGDGAIWISVSGGNSPYSFDWSGPKGYSSTDQNIDQLDAGVYVVEVTDDSGCTAVDSAEIDPSISVTADAGPDTSFCRGDSSLLVGNGGVTGSEWLDSNESSISSGDSAQVAPVSTSEYYYVAYNSPCSDTDTVVVNIDPDPIADAGPDEEILVEEELELGGSPTGPSGSDIIWSPGDWFIDDSSSSNPSIVPEEPGEYTYTVTVTTPEGCVAIDTVVIDVLPDLDIPDGFSPNGDGVNDVWEIGRIHEFPNATVGVYNRWGEQLFYSEGYDEPWDGTYNGKDVPVGTYYYVIELNAPDAPSSIEPTYSGPLTIIR